MAMAQLNKSFLQAFFQRRYYNYRTEGFGICFFGVGVTALLTAWENPALALHKAVVFGGLAFVSVGICLLIWAVVLQEKEGNVAGDNYNIDGDNFGHQGPVHNYGKQPFVLTPKIVSDIVQDCPINKPVYLYLVGPFNIINPMQEKVFRALKAAGRNVETGSAGMDFSISWPSQPLSIEHRRDDTYVLIVPQA